MAASARPGSREIALDEIREESRRALAPLLKAGVVREATSALAAMPARRRPPPLDPVGFWTSGSAVLQIREEDMHNLIEFVPGIEDMLPNRRLLVPPVAVPKQIPQPVEDSKAGTWGIRKIGALSVWGAYGKRGEGSLVGLLERASMRPTRTLKERSRSGRSSTPRARRSRTRSRTTATSMGRIARARSRAAMRADAGSAWRRERRSSCARSQRRTRWDGCAGPRRDRLGGRNQGRCDQHVARRFCPRAGHAVHLYQGDRQRPQARHPARRPIGNEGSQTTGSPGNDLLAFAIGATDPNDRAAGFSGGRTQIIQESSFFSDDILPLIYSKPDVSAPGVAVFSSIPQGAWEHFNGTSMATPHVAGAIALLLSATNVKTVAAAERAFLIQDLLTGSAEELGKSGQNHRFGFGRIDVLRAIGFAHEKGFGP